jgi:hypothetical protein
MEERLYAAPDVGVTRLDDPLRHLGGGAGGRRRNRRRGSNAATAPAPYSYVPPSFEVEPRCGVDGDGGARVSAFTAMSAHQTSYVASYLGKPAQLIVGTVGVQIFEPSPSHKLLTTLHIHHMPEWTVGKTIHGGSQKHGKAAGYEQHWVRCFTGGISPSLLDRRLTGAKQRKAKTTGQLPTRKDLFCHEFQMVAVDTVAFCKDLAQVCTAVAERQRALNDEKLLGLAAEMVRAAAASSSPFAEHHPDGDGAVQDVAGALTPRSGARLVRPAALATLRQVGLKGWNAMDDDDKVAAVRPNGQLLSRRGRSCPASASSLDPHRASITRRFGQVTRHVRFGIHNGRTAHELELGGLDLEEALSQANQRALASSLLPPPMSGPPPPPSLPPPPPPPARELRDGASHTASC